MLRFNFLVVSMLTIIYVIFLAITNKRKKRGFAGIGKSIVMYIYTMLVLKYALFPIQGFNRAADIMREEIGFSRINYIPLRTLYWAFVKAYSYSMIMIILKPIIFNICIAIPFGFLIQLFYRHVVSPSAKIWYALGFGLCIEGLQLLISILIGYTYRTIDIDDIIFSAIGVFIGYRCQVGYSFIVHRLNNIFYQ